MKLIFQIAAGLVIGLLAYQILGFMMMDARNENMDDSLTRAAQLKTGANRIMNMVHEFHGEHRRLPNSLAARRSGFQLLVNIAAFIRPSLPEVYAA